MSLYGRTADRTTTWDPGRYGRFPGHRSRPFFDLVNRIDAADPALVVDLGCGSGELTASLADRWPDAQVLGVDNSASMLEAATAHASDRVSFTSGDLSSYLPDPAADVVVSNAAYQWVDGGSAMLSAIAAQLPAGGWLAVQVPGNFQAPSHRAIGELLATQRWQQATGGLRLREDPVLEPDGYVELFTAAGLTPDVWETTYSQLLPGTDPVLEWVKGTALRPVLTAMAADQREAFLIELSLRLRAAYPPRPYGTVFAFRRIFAIGHRPG
ncbi:MAG: methyltransferase domain-containing protein [Actinomycetota bacterium]|nr:methyltransferase domain-containing protein [Actinomycetota bacterium]